MNNDVSVKSDTYCYSAQRGGCEGRRGGVHYPHCHCQDSRSRWTYVDAALCMARLLVYSAHSKPAASDRSSQLFLSNNLLGFRLAVRTHAQKVPHERVFTTLSSFHRSLGRLTAKLRHVHRLFILTHLLARLISS